MRQHMLDETILLLEEVITEGNNFIAPEIPVFYLGLAYYERGDYRRAADLLDSVSNSPILLKDQEQLGELALRFWERARERMTE